MLDKRLYQRMNYLRESSLRPEDIVLEITERRVIKDVNSFKKNMDSFNKYEENPSILSGSDHKPYQLINLQIPH